MGLNGVINEICDLEENGETYSSSDYFNRILESMQNTNNYCLIFNNINEIKNTELQKMLFDHYFSKLSTSDIYFLLSSGNLFFINNLPTVFEKLKNSFSQYKINLDTKNVSDRLDYFILTIFCTLGLINSKSDSCDNKLENNIKKFLLDNIGEFFLIEDIRENKQQTVLIRNIIYCASENRECDINLKTKVLEYIELYKDDFRKELENGYCYTCDSILERTSGSMLPCDLKINTYIKSIYNSYKPSNYTLRKSV